MRRLLSLICIILSFSLLFSCSEEKKDKDEYDHAADFTKEDGEIYLDVPTARYGGAAFRIYNAKTGSVASKLDSESINGDKLSDILFQRNSDVEERLNVVIEEQRDTPENVFDKAVSACLSGDRTFSGVCTSADQMATMAVCGYLASNKHLDGINLTKPWWNIDAMNSATVGNEYYFFYGDLQLSYFDAHSMVGFNMDIINDLEGVPNPYDLVDSGKWTVDEMLKIIEAAAKDVDGNGIFNAYDRYGAAVDSTAALSMVIGCDTSVFAKGENGIPYATCIGNEKFYDAFSFIADKIYGKNDYIFNVEKYSAEKITAAQMFKAGQSVFYITNVGSLYSLRDMEYEFGVLPMPKFNEYQKDHVSYLHPEKATALGVISTGANLYRSSVILENLAAQSHLEGGLKECYVETVLSFRYVNDERSGKNLRDILQTGRFDMGEIYSWGGLCETVSEICSEGGGKYASSIAALETKTLSDISTTLKELNHLSEINDVE